MLAWGMVLLLAGSRGGRLRLDPLDDADGFDDEYSRPYRPWPGTLMWLAGGLVLAQDAGTSVVWGMPGAVVERKAANEVLPLPELARRLAEVAGAA